MENIFNPSHPSPLSHFVPLFPHFSLVFSPSFFLFLDLSRDLTTWSNIEPEKYNNVFLRSIFGNKRKIILLLFVPRSLTTLVEILEGSWTDCYPMSTRILVWKHSRLIVDMDIIFLFFFFFPEVESVYRFDKVSAVHVLENYSDWIMRGECRSRLVNFQGFTRVQLSCDNGYCLAARNISILIYRWSIKCN